MELGVFFKRENLSLIFDCKQHKGNFIAGLFSGCYSDYLEKGDFSPDWYLTFPNGRYAIDIYQRHSVYIDGKQAYENESFEWEVGGCCRYREPHFVVVLEHEKEYNLPRSPSVWPQPSMYSYIILAEDNPYSYQNRFYRLEEAKEEARKYSLLEGKAAVMSLYEEYGMD